MSVVWEDPPAIDKAPWIKVLEPLMARPGSWARVRTTKDPKSASNSASQLKRGSYVRPPGQWEFKSGKFEDGGAIWARYLGPEEPK